MFPITGGLIPVAGCGVPVGGCDRVCDLFFIASQSRRNIVDAVSRGSVFNLILP